jgi:hypothetical protein
MNVAEPRWLHAAITVARDLTATMSQPRWLVHEGERQLHAVVDAVKVGVIHAINAPHAELVQLSALLPGLHSWGGRPVGVGHPKENGTQVSANQPHILPDWRIGTTYNPRVEHHKLVMDVYLSPSRAARVDGGKRMLERIADGDPVEVSIGAFVGTVAESGIYGGRRYHSKWEHVYPDHLALIPEGQRGACTVSDGCGVRAVARAASSRAAEDRSYLVPPDAYAAIRQRPDYVAAPDYSQQLAQRESFRADYMRNYGLASVLAASQPATDDIYVHPPDPYAEALKRRENNR